MATWLRGLYYGESWFSSIDKRIFMTNYKQFLEAILAKSDIKVACLCDDKDIILGYSVLSKANPTLHWLFVKSAFRKQGIGKSLVPTEITYVSHLTELGKNLLYKLPNATFNPFSL